MSEKTRSKIDDLRGASKLAVEATKGVMGLVEDMHRTIASGPKVLGSPLSAPVGVVTAVVYGSMKGVTEVVGASIDLALDQLATMLGSRSPGTGSATSAGPEHAAVLAVVNGVLGDYLVATDNPLALEMQLRRNAEALHLEADALRAEIPDASGKILLMVHGSSMNDRQWLRKGHDHGEALAEDLEATRVDVLYNSGLHISVNGAQLAELLQKLVEAWPVPVEEIAIVGHSMGGLVARSACRSAEEAGSSWRDLVRSMVFLGTPHHGAPLERGGNWIDVLLDTNRYSAPLARLGKIRSAGVTDLRFGNVLEEHWHGRDRFEKTADLRSPVPLPEDVACYAVAGRLEKSSGDGIVPVNSALGEHDDAAMTLDFGERTYTAEGTGHIELLNSQDVYDRLHHWLTEETPP